ncbi:histidine kinase [Okibacterium endophyticum]
MEIKRRLRLGPVDTSTGLPTVAWWLGVSLVAVTLFSVSVPINSAGYGVQVALAFALGVMQCGSILLAPARPVLAIVVFVVSIFALASMSTISGGRTYPWPWSVTSMLAFAALIALLTFYRGWQLGLWAYLLSLATSVGVTVWQQLGVQQLDAAMANIIIATSITGAVYLLAVLIAQRQRIRAQLLQEREISAAEQSRRMLVEERQRIARELHDVVAHSMSIIQVQATTARYRLPEINDAAATEFDDIGRSAREAMSEMRRLLGVLRNGEEDADLVPQQGIGDIAGLVDSAARAGVAISLSQGEIPADVPASVHVATFRIAQEAISNAVRHAPGAPITVSLGGTTQAVTLMIVNAPSTTPPGPLSRGSGHGLVGMRERASFLGGTVESGPTEGGGYRVRAVLPLHQDLEDTP